MNILEKEIEELLFEAIYQDPVTVRKKGLPLIEGAIYYRQMELGSYGRADIVGVYLGKKIAGKRMIKIHVIELKKDKIDFGSLNQALAYATAIKKIIEKRLKGSEIETFISLVGKSLDTSGGFCYLPDICENVGSFLYELDFYCGLRFVEQRGFGIVNANLPRTEIIDEVLAGYSMQRFAANYYARKQLTEQESIDDMAF